MRILLLGASFDTGNLGVSALAWSSIKLIQERWPESEIVLLGVGRTPGHMSFDSEGSCQRIRTLPIRYCANMCAANHILGMMLASFVCRCLPMFSKYWMKGESAFSVILGSDAICDITGGDSFSDIYGFQRYFKNYLLKRVCQNTKRPYILLPQTYGPFKYALSRHMARIIFKNTDLILSRDAASLELARELTPPNQGGHYALSPDVAFTLEPHAVDDSMTHRICRMKADGHSVIGVNISGLLYHNGYTGQNEFGLVSNYRRLVEHLVAEFAKMSQVKVLLVPHVVPRHSEGAVESDLEASQALLESLETDVKKHVVLAQGDYDQCAIKYLIGECDFFIGSRMHATIASLSQMIPTIGLAYSKKFSGVYQSIGMEACVLDLRKKTEAEILAACSTLYGQRETLTQRLTVSVPDAQQKVKAMLNHVELQQNQPC